jgi:hypothetical protein
VSGNDYVPQVGDQASRQKHYLSNAREQEGNIIMHRSIKVALTGLLITGALAFSVAGADAMGASGNSNGPDAFIGIVGGNPGSSVGGIPYNRGGYPADTDRHFGHTYHNDHGGYGTYNGGY